MSAIVVTRNTGKTIFSYYLARELCRCSKKIIVVTPDIDFCVAFCLFFDNKCEKSIGKILEKATVTKQELFSQMYFAGENLAYLGYAPNENRMSYPEILPENCRRILAMLTDLADFVIIDGKSQNAVLENNIVTEETININVCSADRRGVAYRSANKSICKKRIEIVNGANEYCNSLEILPTYRKKPYMLPYVKSFGEIYSIAKISEINAPTKYLRPIKNIIRGELLC